MDQATIAGLLPSLLPPATEWATAVCRWALENGKPLHPTSKADAILMGVADPDAVRVVVVEKIPQPEAYPALMEAARSLSFLSENTAGLPLGSAILIRRNYAGYRQLIAHELVHVGQSRAF